MYDINLKKDRNKIIHLFYRYFVLNYQPDQMKQDILSEKQVVWSDPKIEELVLEIANQVTVLTSEIQTYLKKEWDWKRLPNFIKACLIEGSFEIKNTNIPKAITIDSITNLVKVQQPDWDYKFVNAVLDKFTKI